MAEKRFKQDYDGQAIIQSDLNLLGEVSGLADDRVLAELIRLTPYDGSTVARGIIPYSHLTSGNVGLVVPAGATGSVNISPFRAVIGSRTAVASGPRANWRDIRTALSVAEAGTSLSTQVSFAANATGNGRWDLVYAAVAIDVNGPTSSRLVKDPSSAVVSPTTVAQYMHTTVTIGVVQGTASATPALPSAPSDAGSTYYIPLAYVAIPNGFNASSTVDRRAVFVVAKCLQVRPGGVEIADSLYTPGSAALGPSRTQPWGATGARPDIYIPSTAAGGVDLLVAIDARTGNLSHADGSIVDTRDWRGRIVHWTAVVAGPSNTFLWAWESGGIGSLIPMRNAATGSFVGMDVATPANNGLLTGIGSTFGSSNPLIARVSQGRGISSSLMASGTEVVLKCDGSGRMIVGYTGAPNCKVFFWLRFSGVFEGYEP